MFLVGFRVWLLSLKDEKKINFFQVSFSAPSTLFSLKHKKKQYRTLNPTIIELVPK